METKLNGMQIAILVTDGFERIESTNLGKHWKNKVRLSKCFLPS